MKKKIAIIIGIALCTTMISGCSSANSTATSETTEATTAATTTVATFENGLTENDFEVQEYLLNPADQDTANCFLVVKNNSSKSVKYMNIKVTAYDTADNVISTQTAIAMNMAPGEQTLCDAVFENVKGIDHVSKKITECSVGTFSPIIGKIEYKLIEQTNGSLSYLITNNSENTIKSGDVLLYALFFDPEGKIVGFRIGLPSESIPAGKTGAVVIITLGIEYDAFKNYIVAFA